MSRLSFRDAATPAFLSPQSPGLFPEGRLPRHPHLPVSSHCPKPFSPDWRRCLVFHLPRHPHLPREQALHQSLFPRTGRDVSSSTFREEATPTFLFPQSPGLFPEGHLLRHPHLPVSSHCPKPFSPDWRRCLVSILPGRGHTNFLIPSIAWPLPGRSPTPPPTPARQQPLHQSLFSRTGRDDSYPPSGKRPHQLSYPLNHPAPSRKATYPATLTCPVSRRCINPFFCSSNRFL